MSTTTTTTSDCVLCPFHLSCCNKRSYTCLTSYHKHIVRRHGSEAVSSRRTSKKLYRESIKYLKERGYYFIGSWVRENGRDRFEVTEWPLRESVLYKRWFVARLAFDSREERYVNRGMIRKRDYQEKEGGPHFITSVDESVIESSIEEEPVGSTSVCEVKPTKGVLRRFFDTISEYTYFGDIGRPQSDFSLEGDY